MYAPGDVGTLAEIQEFYRSQKVDTTIIELMNQTNDILDHVPFREANTIKGHETRLRTGLPEIYFRQLYRGTPISKSQYSRVVEGIGMLEGRMELDVKEKELYGATFGTYRASEAKAFMEALRQKAATLFFYGDHARLADEFDGFATRYSDLSNPHVIDANDFTFPAAEEEEGEEEGEETGLTSMYLVAWGPDSVHGIFPKESIGGLKHTDLGTYTTTDNEMRKFEVYGDLFSWNLGLAVRDWRAVVRICNIKTKYLANTLTGALANNTQSDSSTTTREGGWINLKDMTIIAKSKIPAGMRRSSGDTSHRHR